MRIEKVRLAIERDTNRKSEDVKGTILPECIGECEAAAFEKVLACELREKMDSIREKCKVTHLVKKSLYL
jgi:hypothetical protein